MIEVTNCTKCGTYVEHPLKKWNIKQTPIGLFECPSCNTKWRSKLEVPINPSLQIVSEIKKEDIDTPVIQTIETIPTRYL